MTPEQAKAISEVITSPAEVPKRGAIVLALPWEFRLRVVSCYRRFKERPVWQATATLFEVKDEATAMVPVSLWTPEQRAHAAEEVRKLLSGVGVPGLQIAKTTDVQIHTMRPCSMAEERRTRN